MLVRSIPDFLGTLRRRRHHVVDVKIYDHRRLTVAGAIEKDTIASVIALGAVASTETEASSEGSISPSRRCGRPDRRYK
jgi:hypothetical protein